MTDIAETASIRGGYSMADLDRLAKVSARRHGGSTDAADRYDAAWFGIVSHLYEADETPTERDLLFAGIRAVRESMAERNQAQGRSHRYAYEFGSAPRFATYWNEALVEPSHEEPIVERTALAQALATLTAEQYEALAAAAVCQTLTQAAQALGIPYWRFIDRFYAARAAVLAVWFEGETPPSKRTSSQTCRSGHDRPRHWRTGPSGHGYCGECQRLAKRRRRARGAAA